MSRARLFEPIPCMPPPVPPIAVRPVSAATRRRQLRRALRAIAAFSATNRYQAELQALTLAMLAYMREHWCGPGRADDFDRWWRIADYYGRALRWPVMAGPGARKMLLRVLEQNQVPPCAL